MPLLSDEIAVLILAAGRGSRLGGGKLLLPWRGKPVLCHTIDAAAAMEKRGQLYVVVGYDSENVKTALTRHPAAKDAVQIIDNPAWEQGQSTSLRRGIEAIPKTAGGMVLLGDQPLVRTATLNLLAHAYLTKQADENPPLAAAPFFEEKRGNPVILSPALFPRIMKIEGDTGARTILSTLGNRLLKVPVDDPGVVTDIDSREDYEELTRGGSES